MVGGTLVTAHVGDCRLFLLRGDDISQLTKDHTWVAEQVQYGLLSPEAARTHPRRGTVTRCLGPDLIVGIDVLSFDLQRGDVVVQCSDGVHGLLTDKEIAVIVRRHPPEAGGLASPTAEVGAGSGDDPRAASDDRTAGLVLRIERDCVDRDRTRHRPGAERHLCRDDRELAVPASRRASRMSR
ncbi:MAG TPA: hypothetical protein VKH82_01120 [Candidatus Binatia bacterium]|nr:hypothetical protein [Candidatus Binatia bacterium]